MGDLCEGCKYFRHEWDVNAHYCIKQLEPTDEECEEYSNCEDE